MNKKFHAQPLLAGEVFLTEGMCVFIYINQ